MSKHKLLDEVFAVGGNHDLKKLKAAEIKLVDYIRENGNDPQINDALRMLKMFADENEHNDYEQSAETVAPVYERLSHADEWDFYDIRIFGAVIGYEETYEKSLELAEYALKKLEKYSDKKQYPNIKLSIHMNILLRFLRARYFDLDDMNDTRALEKLESSFIEHFDAAMTILENDGSPVWKAIITARKGIFFRDNKLMGESFSVLENAKEPEAYRLLQAEASEYEFYSGLTISRKQFNAIVGRNIRRERIRCKLSIDDVAVILDMTPAAVGLMERGDRGQTSFNLRKLAEVFGISTDVLFSEGSGPGASSHRERVAQIHKFAAFAKGLTNEELEHLVAVAESLAKLSKSNRKNS